METKLAPLLIAKQRVGTYKDEISKTRPPLPYGNKSNQDKAPENKDRKHVQHPNNRGEPRGNHTHTTTPPNRQDTTSKTHKEKRWGQKFTRFTELTDGEESEDEKFFKNHTFLTFEHDEEVDQVQEPPD